MRPLLASFRLLAVATVLLVSPAALAQAPDAIVGRWTIDRIIDGNGDEIPQDLQEVVGIEFTSDGRVLAVPAPGVLASDLDEGTYRIEGNQLVSTENGREQRAEFWFEGDAVLVLFDPIAGFQAHLHRATE